MILILYYRLELDLELPTAGTATHTTAEQV